MKFRNRLGPNTLTFQGIVMQIWCNLDTTGCWGRIWSIQDLSDLPNPISYVFSLNLSSDHHQNNRIVAKIDSEVGERIQNFVLFWHMCASQWIDQQFITGVLEIMMRSPLANWHPKKSFLSSVWPNSAVFGLKRCKKIKNMVNFEVNLTWLHRF